MRSLARCVLVFAVTALLATAGGALSMWFVADWLSNEDPVDAAGAILALAGEPSRALHAAALFSKGLAPVVVLSKPVHTHSQKLLARLGIPYPPQEALYRDILVKKGVPPSSIHVLPEPARSTVDEAMAARRIDLGRTRTLLVVSSPYHVRRVKLIFRDVLPQARVIVTANPYEPYPRRWWTDQDVARNVVLEPIKIAFYLAGGRFTASGEPAKGN